MTRIGKKEERRNRYPFKHKNPAPKTGPLQDNLPEGYKPHANAVDGDVAKQVFIGKIGA